jgi:hypothetical protein
LIGRIAEGGGLNEIAEQNSTAISKPEIETGDAANDPAQIPLNVMHPAK